MHSLLLKCEMPQSSEFHKSISVYFVIYLFSMYDSFDIYVQPAGSVL